jgi:glycogen phosphorylase
MNLNHYLPRPLPKELRGLAVLALDLRWSWNHAADALWETVDAVMWRATGNPWLILGSVSQVQLAKLAKDPYFLDELRRQLSIREEYLAEPTWFAQAYNSSIGTIAYFSMEFGLSEALPIYSGGLGMLAGDFLKTASDLGVPMVGVGLLYDRGYFRQSLDVDGEQLAFYPYNEPHLMPLTPLRDESNEWLRITIELPGRTLHLLTWAVQVGRVTLYLLDSNDPLNSPRDRGITAELYGGSPELRLQQELVLGIGGWRLLEKLNVDCKICHLNEGHAAFAALERIRSFMARSGQTFRAALHCTRTGNIFTTHTPVAAAFDEFPADLVRRYGRRYAERLCIDMEELLALGRINSHESAEPFNMAYLALRCCGRVNAVSRLHDEVSRSLFQPLFERWPRRELPISYVTNGVHVPTWDSAAADAVWTEICGKRRWLGTLETLEQDLSCASDEALWALRAQGRAALTKRVQERANDQQTIRGDETAADPVAARLVLDHNALTIGFARRFTGYKRPNLLLHDRKRLTKILTDSNRPVQLLVAGKAHPLDLEGARMVREWVEYLQSPEVCHRAVFLEDYDMAMAAELVQGVDLWINTPRRPWEACGTSGMKVLVNGGLNLSELDGWWAEAYSPDVGWALGDAKEHPEPEWDSVEADQLYSLLEHEVIPTFYERDGHGIPRRWVAKMRASMARLTSRFSTNRMVREYTENYYVPAAAELAGRIAANGEMGTVIEGWRQRIAGPWSALHFGSLGVSQSDSAFTFDVQVYLGEIPPADVQVELWADPADGERETVKTMEPVARLAGMTNGFIYRAVVAADRPAGHYTPRVVPRKSGVNTPLEASEILWFR